VRRERRLEIGRAADERKLDGKVTRGRHGPVNDRGGRLIAAHRVDGDGYHLRFVICDL
jgi:hypothetical protein